MQVKPYDPAAADWLWIVVCEYCLQFATFKNSRELKKSDGAKKSRITGGSHRECLNEHLAQLPQSPSVLQLPTCLLAHAFARVHTHLDHPLQYTQMQSAQTRVLHSRAAV